MPIFKKMPLSAEKDDKVPYSTIESQELVTRSKNYKVKFN